MTQATRLSATPEPMHQWAVAADRVIAGDTWGDRGARVVVLLHGGGQTRHAWKGTGRLLASAGYRAVAFDARGHGDSGWALDGDYGQPAMVADLEAVLDAVGAQRPVLVGASMGGLTSLVALGRERVDAAALVLVDVAPSIDPEGAARVHRFMGGRPEGFDTLEQVADAISAYQPHRTRPRRLHGLAKNVRLGLDGRYYWHWDPAFAPDERGLLEQRAMLEDCARRVDVPALLVRGGLSDVLTEEGAREFLTLCPHAEYANVTGAAHMVAGDRNDVFGRALLDFVLRVAPPSPDR